MTRIADNRKARHDYFIEEEFEAGMVLEGWEVKAIRAGRTQIGESHIVIRNGELFVLNMLISPLGTASTHIRPDASRTRKMIRAKQSGCYSSRITAFNFYCLSLFFTTVMALATKLLISDKFDGIIRLLPFCANWEKAEI